ncbi:U32 family peptidase [Paenibacillus sp. GSMTC-2017]|uniref:peptidase U32 family protein n=1 Tax=Paenibacillus sp. GSMTC-2017 TaxID=2794350 RepID=UPI0018D94B05|nr:U32 family peptidase [Paenibacillus sp. GSMTC-2017]MBH5318817.1 U32 family peptidase [Paenibacillus sp. GSMTC-2017]
MNIVAPARSPFMLKEMIEAGANEVYIGLKPKSLRKLSFDGRFQTVADYPAHVEDEETLESMVKFAKRDGIKVAFMANPILLPRDYEDEYKRHVATAVEIGVDFVTVSSLQCARIIRKAGITVPLIAGSSFSLLNRGALRMLKDWGFERANVPHSISIEELAGWKEEGLQLQMTGNFGSGSVPGLCRLWESPNNLEMGDGTRSVYRLTLPNGGTLDQSSFLDAATDCSLCSLRELEQAGISSIKLIGREAPNPSTLAVVIDLFRQWLDMESEGKPVSKKIEVMEREMLMWTMKWVPRFCDKQRCTYLATPVTNSYV